MIAAPYLVPWIIRSKHACFPEAIWQVPSAEREIALTFDDGPSRFTPGLLDVLQKRAVRATFFVLGDRVQRHGEVISRIQREGHQLGLHGYHHWSFRKHPLSEVLSNLQRGREVLERCLGAPIPNPVLCRPPFGHCRTSTLRALRAEQMELVFYGVLPGEQLLPRGWRETPSTVCRRVLKALCPGLIIALHDGEATGGQDGVFDGSQIGEVADAVILAAQTRGYRFVNLEPASRSQLDASR